MGAISGIDGTKQSTSSLRATSAPVKQVHPRPLPPSSQGSSTTQSAIAGTTFCTQACLGPPESSKNDVNDKLEGAPTDPNRGTRGLDKYK